MSKLTNIKAKINQLEGGAFQEFCDAYLVKKGYDGICQLGMKSGTMKTTKGTPDTYFPVKSGKYVFVQYTTQQQNINRKIEEDIQKCLSQNITGIDVSDIEEIIVCHTSSTLAVGEDKRLREMCSKKGVLLSLYGIDRIANDIFSYYPILARDCLGETMDTEQIFRSEEFVATHDSNDIAAPLATKFQFREKEVNEITASLDNNKVVLIFGKAGIGKTRLVLEVCNRYSEMNSYRFYCIRNNNLAIYEDLKTFFEVPGKYIILIDDANELVGKRHILQYLTLGNKGYEIKIIMTVRDYAKQTLFNEVKEFAVPKIFEICKFTDDEIKKLIEINLEIRNALFLEQIVRISEGNPRIAFLAGKLAIDTQDLKSIQDTTELFDQYYGKYLSSSMIALDRDICLSCGIIALLQVINLDQLDNLHSVLATADMSIDEFKKNIEKLHDIECVDIYHDKVARISDQCFSNYLLYYAFFERKFLPFSVILEIGFKNFRSGIIKAINVLLNVFSSESFKKYISEEVKIVWRKFKNEDDNLFFEFVKVFHVFQPLDALLFIQQKIEGCEEEKTDIDEVDFEKKDGMNKDDILEVLSGFNNSKNIDEAVELMLIYCERRQSIIVETTDTIKNRYGVDKDSQQYDYYSQKRVAKKLASQCENSKIISRIFLNVAKNMLSLSFNPVESGRGNRIIMYRIPVVMTEGAKEYRTYYWEGILRLIINENYYREVFEILEKYSNGWEENIDINVISFDLPFIQKVLSAIANANRIKGAKICESLKKKCKHFSIPVPDWFNSYFDCTEWEIYSLLSSRFRDLDDNYEECAKKRKTKIEEHATKCGENDFDEFISICDDLAKDLSSESWELNQGLGYFFSALENKKEKFISLVKSYLRISKFLNVSPNPIVITLIEHLGVDMAYELIVTGTYEQKNQWLFSFYAVLKKDKIRKKDSESMLEFLQDTSDKDIKCSPYRRLDFLDKYIGVDEDIYIKASKIILGKFSYYPFIAILYFDFLFNENCYQPDDLIKIYAKDEHLLQKVYFCMLEHEQFHDCSGLFIKRFIEKDESWLTIYIEHIIDSAKNRRQSDHQRFVKCWECENFIYIFDKIYYSLENDNEIYPWVLASFFHKVMSHADKKSIIAANQEKWILHMISENHNNEKIETIFRIVSELNIELRKKCIIHFLSLNRDYSTFERLMLEPSHWGGVGSMIPYMEQRIQFYESLLPYFSGLELLKHKKLLFDNIEEWKRRILSEQVEEIIRSNY